jgi:hypothetical protein
MKGRVPSIAGRRERGPRRCGRRLAKPTAAARVRCKPGVFAQTFEAFADAAPLPTREPSRHGIEMADPRTPRLCAPPEAPRGAAALDSATDMAARYYAFPQLRGGRRLQELARVEIGGTPLGDPLRYRLRSPIDRAEEIASSGVPLHIWWSTRDRIVTNRRDESRSSVPAPEVARASRARDRVRRALGAQPRVPRRDAPRARPGRAPLDPASRCDPAA